MYIHIIVGDSAMTRIMDLPKENIIPRTKLVEQRAAAAVVSTLPVFVYIEPRRTLLRDLDTFV